MIWFSLSICLSILRCQAIDSLWLVPNYIISNCQNFDINSLSRSKIISSGSLWLAITIYKNVYASSLILLPSLYRIKYIYFVSLSTIVKILLYLTFVNGSSDSRSFTIKSYKIDSYSYYTTDRGYNSLYSLCLLFLFCL